MAMLYWAIGSRAVSSNSTRDWVAASLRLEHVNGIFVLHFQTITFNIAIVYWWVRTLTSQEYLSPSRDCRRIWISRGRFAILDDHNTPASVCATACATNIIIDKSKSDPYFEIAYLVYNGVLIQLKFTFLILNWTTDPSWPATFRLMCSVFCSSSAIVQKPV